MSSLRREHDIADYQSCSDLELAQLACKGSLEAWKVLYLRHWDFLWGFACYGLKLPKEIVGLPYPEDKEDNRVEWEAKRNRLLDGRVLTAEVFVNEVYLIVWDQKKLCSYKESGPFHRWYAVVAASIFNELLRRKRLSNPPGFKVPLEEEHDE